MLMLVFLCLMTAVWQSSATTSITSTPPPPLYTSFSLSSPISSFGTSPPYPGSSAVSGKHTLHPPLSLSSLGTSSTDPDSSTFLAKRVSTPAFNMTESSVEAVSVLTSGKDSVVAGSFSLDTGFSDPSMSVDVPLTTSDDFASFLPSSALNNFTDSSVITSPPPTTTLSIEEQLTCGTIRAPPGKNVNMRPLAPGVVEYSCKAGFRYNGTGTHITECRSNRWSAVALECVPMEIEEDPIDDPPEWLTVLVILLVVILLLALALLFAVAVYICRGKHGFKQTDQWQQEQVVESPAPQKKQSAPRRWPWKRVPKHPPGHIGPDGVAWVISADHDLLPVQRRV